MARISLLWLARILRSMSHLASRKAVLSMNQTIYGREIWPTHPLFPVAILPLDFATSKALSFAGMIKASSIGSHEHKRQWKVRNTS